MKKTVLFLFLSLVVLGCKKSNDQKVIEKTDPCIKIKKKASELLSPSCANNPTLLEFLCLKKVEDQVDWLKINGHKICDESLYECIDSLHAIDENKFSTFAKKHPSNASKIEYKEKTWGEIFDKIKDVKCYDQYLGFDLSGTDIKLKLVNQFTTDETCYSIPFLKGIQLKHSLKPDAILYFTKAMIPSHEGTTTIDKEKVIFKLSNTNLSPGFYDLSDFPGAVKGENHPFGL